MRRPRRARASSSHAENASRGAPCKHLDLLHAAGEIALVEQGLGAREHGARAVAGRGLVDALDLDQVEALASRRSMSEPDGAGAAAASAASSAAAKDRASSGTVGMPLSA